MGLLKVQKNYNSYKFILNPKIIAAFASIMFAYAGASTFPTIQADMKDREKFIYSAIIAILSEFYKREVILSLIVTSSSPVPHLLPCGGCLLLLPGGEPHPRQHRAGHVRGLAEGHRGGDAPAPPDHHLPDHHEPPGTDSGAPSSHPHTFQLEEMRVQDVLSPPASVYRRVHSVIWSNP